MKLVPDDVLLALWERGTNGPPGMRALDVLAVYGHDPVGLPAGSRDAALLVLHEECFGPLLEAVTDCPACGQSLDVSVAAGELGSTVREHADGGGSHEVTVEGYVVRFHAPTAGELADVAVLPAGTPPDTAVDMLRGRTIETATLDGRPVATDDLPDDVRVAVEQAMEASDRGAETTLRVECPGCGNGWSEVLDPVEFVWAQVDLVARRVADEVQALASAYGWSEHDILAMTPVRRRLYLQVVDR